jgi:hypothetical protein
MSLASPSLAAAVTALGMLSGAGLLPCRVLTATI